jgi:hypothetical protein
MKVIERPQETVVRPHVRDLRGSQPAYQAFSVLYAGYILLPVIAGIDKFTHILVDWNQYLSPAFASLAGGRADLMMRGVGIVEIVAGLLVAARPRIGSVVVAAWLCGIIVNLLLLPGYFDVALRDFGLALGALALSRLSAQYSA